MSNALHVSMSSMIIMSLMVVMSSHAWVGVPNLQLGGSSASGHLCVLELCIEVCLEHMSMLLVQSMLLM